MNQHREEKDDAIHLVEFICILTENGATTVDTTIS
jgi:hypothetical protein